MSDLKPCPFCGGRAEETAGGPGPEFWVYCRLCRAASQMFNDAERARFAWNRRVADREENKSDE